MEARSRFLVGFGSTQMLFLTQCKKNGESYEGPVIEAESWEQARVYADHIQVLENQTGREFTNLEVVGEAVSKVSTIKCGNCGNVWVEVYPVDVRVLQCRKCKLHIIMD